MATKSASLHAQLRVDVRFRHARHDHFPFGIPPLYSPAHARWKDAGQLSQQMSSPAPPHRRQQCSFNSKTPSSPPCSSNDAASAEASRAFLRPPPSPSLGSSSRPRFVEGSLALRPPPSGLPPLRAAASLGAPRAAAPPPATSPMYPPSSPRTKSAGSRCERHVDEPLSWKSRPRSDCTLCASASGRRRSTVSHHDHTSRRRLCSASRRPWRMRRRPGHASSVEDRARAAALRSTARSSPDAFSMRAPPNSSATRRTSSLRTDEFHSLRNESPCVCCARPCRCAARFTSFARCAGSLWAEEDEGARGRGNERVREISRRGAGGGGGEA